MSLPEKDTGFKQMNGALIRRMLTLTGPQPKKPHPHVRYICSASLSALFFRPIWPNLLSPTVQMLHPGNSSLHLTIMFLHFSTYSTVFLHQNLFIVLYIYIYIKHIFSRKFIRRRVHESCC